MSVYIKDPKQDAKGCIIWMHGLGADAKDMMGIAEEFPETRALRHIFLDAPIRPVTINNHIPMRAWYDIIGMTLSDREDKAGILDSEKLVRNVMEKQISDGFPSEKIFLAGFSQGAAMALFTSLHTSHPLAGVIALSGYLPLMSEAQCKLERDTPFFIAAGEYDSVVFPVWSGMSVTYLQEQGYERVKWQRYPMAHTTCMQEIHDLGEWISQILENRI